MKEHFDIKETEFCEVSQKEIVEKVRVERRFLYKIQFNRPTVEARIKIWQAMLPLLTEKEAHTIASQFDLSGGEIENIIRKYTINAILSGKEGVDIPSIIEICRNERITNSTRAKIGFQL